MLIGPDRMRQKKELELLAQASAALTAATLAGETGFTGIPVVSGLTVSINMQITDLRFTQSAQKRDALDVSISLQHIPLPDELETLVGAASLVLAAGTLAIPSAPAPAFTPRLPGAQL
jgi:hypothetical protein